VMFTVDPPNPPAPSVTRAARSSNHPKRQTDPLPGPRKPCFLAGRPYKPGLPLDPGRELNGRPRAFSPDFPVGERRRQGQMARRPVFPPSEHSSLSRKGSKGYAPGRAHGTRPHGTRPHGTQRERHSMPLYEHVFLSRQDASTQQV